MAAAQCQGLTSITDSSRSARQALAPHHNRRERGHRHVRTRSACCRVVGYGQHVPAAGARAAGAEGGSKPERRCRNSRLLCALRQVLGVGSVFLWPAPVALKQGYLVVTGVVTAYMFTFVPEWTTWTMLIAMALYDLWAVLVPGGPLKARPAHSPGVARWCL